jgi:hypothetical protein
MKEKYVIKYKYKNIEFTIKFCVKYPPKEWRFEVSPDIKDIKIYHKGEKINSVINSDMYMDLVTYLYDNYAKLPDKRELRKAKLKRILCVMK